MRSDFVEHALKGQPVWQPPEGFARRVVARVPPSDVRRRTGAHLRVVGAAGIVASALLATGAAYVSAVVLAMVTPTVIRGVEGMTGAFVAHVDLVAWVSAAVTVSLAASVTGFLREWL